MDNNEVWATCGDCGAELKQSDKQCPKCGSSQKVYGRKASVDIGVKVVETRVTQKRKGFKKFMRQMTSRWKRSRDPKLRGSVGEEVKEELVIDKEKDWKDHIVKDARTGEILHEEHEPLSKHKGKSV